MSITAEKKSQVIGENQRSDKDTGSPEVQIAILTERINTLHSHFAAHKHDHASRRGLLGMVSRRNRLLRFLRRTNRESYLALIKKLGLRK